jgi:hypothetical protein
MPEAMPIACEILRMRLPRVALAKTGWPPSGRMPPGMPARQPRLARTPTATGVGDRAHMHSQPEPNALSAHVGVSQYSRIYLTAGAMRAAHFAVASGNAAAVALQVRASHILRAPAPRKLGYVTTMHSDILVQTCWRQGVALGSPKLGGIASTFSVRRFAIHTSLSTQSNRDAPEGPQCRLRLTK